MTDPMKRVRSRRRGMKETGAEVDDDEAIREGLEDREEDIKNECHRFIETLEEFGSVILGMIAPLKAFAEELRKAGIEGDLEEVEEIESDDEIRVSLRLDRTEIEDSDDA